MTPEHAALVARAREAFATDIDYAIHVIERGSLYAARKDRSNAARRKTDQR